MQYPWLEKMASVGDIRPEAKARIYEDCCVLMKLAAAKPSASKPMSGAEVAQSAGRAALEFGAGQVVEHIWDRLVDRGRMKNTIKAIQQSRASLLKDPVFNDYKEKADARFTELAKIAPTIASNEEKARTLVGKALHTGFSNEDMNHLAVLQAIYTSNDPNYTPRVVGQMQKKASAERLGEMYADVLSLVKEAGLFDAISGGIQRGGAAAAEGVAKASGGIRPATAMQILKNVALVSSIPLLAGVGQGLVSEYSASRDSKRMAAKLRESFNEAMRQSKKDDPNKTRGVSLSDNPSEALRAFQTLVHFAPHVALHADSARTFMSRMVDQGQFMELPDAKQLTEIEKNLSGAGKQSPFFEGFSSAVKAVGLGEGIRSVIKDTTGPMRDKASEAVSRDLGMKSSKSGR